MPGWFPDWAEHLEAEGISLGLEVLVYRVSHEVELDSTMIFDTHTFFFLGGAEVLSCKRCIWPKKKTGIVFGGAWETSKHSSIDKRSLEIHTRKPVET